MADSKKNRGSLLKNVIVASVLAAIVLFYFYSISNRDVSRSEKEKTELQQLVDYDMINEYPNTPRDLAKLHSRYSKLIYSAKLDDEELDILNKQMRELYSLELLTLNSEQSSLEGLKTDIANYNEQNLTYKSYELPEASQVKYYNQDGVEMATLEVTLTVQIDDKMSYVYIQYLMKNENGKWKIYGWGESAFNK